MGYPGYPVPWQPKLWRSATFLPWEFLPRFFFIFRGYFTIFHHISPISRWWFQTLFIFTPIWGRFPIGLIFSRWVETTNQICLGVKASYVSWFLLVYRWVLLQGGPPISRVISPQVTDLFSAIYRGPMSLHNW